MKITYATQSTAHTQTVHNREAASFKDFYEEVLEPMRISEEKVGSTFIPSLFRAPSRLAENVIHTSLLIFDIDQKEGDDLVSMEEVEDVMYDLGLEHAVYTSFSNTASVQRFRLVIPASRPIYPEEYPYIMSAMVEELDEFLDGRFSKVIDRCWKNEVSRCYYTFTVHPDRRNGAISFYNPGNPADIDELKLRQSTYGQDIEYASASKARKPGTAVGAQGRSMELNRILGGLFRTCTEEQITNAIFESDKELHGSNAYFADPQYSRNRPRPGESQNAASIRSCRAWVKSHINWLRRKASKTDYTIINKRGENKGAVPQHDAVIQIWKAENQSQNGKEKIKLSCKILSGEHAGAIFWHTVFGEGHPENAIKVSKDLARNASIATKTNIESIKDMVKLSGKIAKARIKYKDGTNGFKPQNEIGAIYIE